MFIQEFSNCLSDKERNRVSRELLIISQLSLKQITIDTFINDIKTDNLENDLNELKTNQ